MEDKEFETKEQSVVEEVIANKPKKNKSKIVIIFLLILIVLGVSGYFIYTNCFENKDKKENKEVKPLVENTEFTNKLRESFELSDDDKSNKEIDEILNRKFNIINDQELVTKLKNKNLLNGELNDIDLEDCKYLLGKVQAFTGYGWTDEYDIYHVDKLLETDIPNDLKIILTAQQIISGKYTLPSYVTQNGNTILKIDTFKKIYINIFGNDKFEQKSTDDHCPGVQFEDNFLKIFDQCGDMSVPSMYDMAYKASIKDNELYIYELVAYINYGNSTSDIAELYKDKEKTELICNTDCNLYANAIGDLSLDHADEFAQYKYTFKLKDNNYYFYSVERVD